MKPTVESAVVYRAAGRRWLTLRGACNAAAREKIKARCECESSEPGYSHGNGYPGYICQYHSDHDYYQRLIKRLARRYARAMFKNSLLPKSDAIL